jgi:hypothetical protein
MTRNWPLLPEALKRMGRVDLIGNSKRHLVPSWQPRGTGAMSEGVRRPDGASPRPFRTRHTGSTGSPPDRRKRGGPLPPAAVAAPRNSWQSFMILMVGSGVRSGCVACEFVG